MLKGLLLIVCLGISPVFGEESSGEVALEFSFVGWGEELEGLSYLKGKNRVDAGKIPLFKKGKRVKYRGPALLPLFSDAVAAGEEGEKPAAIVRIPTHLKRAMILVARRNEGFQALVVPDVSSAPTGEAVVMNLSSQPLGLRANKKDLIGLKTQKSTVLGPGEKNLLQLEAHVQEGEEWKRVRNFFLPLAPDTKTMVFFLKSQSDYFKGADGRVSKELQYVVIRQEPGAEEEASGAGGVAEEDAADEE